MKKADDPLARCYDLTRGDHPAWRGHGPAYQELSSFYASNVSMPETERRAKLKVMLTARNRELWAASQAMTRLLKSLED